MSQQVPTGPEHRKRWPPAVALVATLLIASVLLFGRVRETPIELDLEVEHVGWTLPRQQALTGVMNLAALGASGLKDVQLPPLPGLALDAGAAASAFHVSIAARGQGAVTLAPLAPPAGTRVWIERTSVPQELRLSLQGAEMHLRADVRGRVLIALGDQSPAKHAFESPRPVLLQAAERTDLDLTLAGEARPALVRQLDVSDLTLHRIEQFEEGGRTLVRNFSTILSGTLYYEALNGSALQLRPAEALHFARSQGLIRLLQPREEHLALRFHGQVRGMHTGWGEVQRSLMPTYLEWLKARHGLYLLWGTTLYLFGLIGSILRWWGVRL